MPKNLSFKLVRSSEQVHRYGLEVLYRERQIPTTLSIFFCNVKYVKADGKFIVGSHRTYSYNFDYKLGELQYVSHHNGDFTKPDFRWVDTRVVQFEQDKIGIEHHAQAKKTVRKVYDYIQEEKQNYSDYHWQDKYGPFLSPLEIILGMQDKE